MKKWFVAALVALLVAICFGSALAEDDFIFLEYDDGTAVLQCYCGSAESVKVPAEHNGRRVIAIAPCAFYNMDGRLNGLKSVVIEPGIEEIGECAFARCRALESVTMPGTVREIERYAFDLCNALKRVELPEGVDKIGEFAFSRCEALESVTLPSTLRVIGSQAFSEDEALKDVQAGEQSAIQLGYAVFPDQWMAERSNREYVMLGRTLVQYNGNARNVTIPDGVECIGAGAFMGKADLLSVNIGPDVRWIGDWAFSGCERLEYFLGGDNITRISTHAFNQPEAFCDENGMFILGGVMIKYNGSESRVTIPEGIVSIAEGAFANHYNDLKEVVLPESLEHIGLNAFRDCHSLSSVRIPSGVREIDGNPFIRCDAIRNGEFVSDNERFVALDDFLYDLETDTVVSCLNCRARSLTLPAQTRNTAIGAMEHCLDATRIDLPDGLRRLGSYSLCHCASLREIVIPDTVYCMEGNVFNGCDNLESVTVGSGVADLNTNTFANCPRLARVSMGGNVRNLYDAWLDSCPNVTLYVAKGSCAWKYAEEMGIAYVIDESLTTDARMVVRAERHGVNRGAWLKIGGFMFDFPDYMVCDNTENASFLWCESGDACVYMEFWFQHLGASAADFVGTCNYDYDYLKELVENYARKGSNYEIHPVPRRDVGLDVPGCEAFFINDEPTDNGVVEASNAIYTFYNARTGNLLFVHTCVTNNSQYTYDAEDGDFKMVLASIRYDEEYINNMALAEPNYAL